MTTDDMMEYIDLSLSQMGRRIIGEQRQCIEQSLKANPQPVFAQLVRYSQSVQPANRMEFVMPAVKFLIVRATTSIRFGVGMLVLGSTQFRIPQFVKMRINHTKKAYV